MSDFISDIDTAKPYVQFLRPLSQCVVFMKVLINMNKILSGRLREQKKTRKSPIW